MPYFFDPPGQVPKIKADIERHRREEQTLRRKIHELEGKPDDFSRAVERAYQLMLSALLDSKAAAVERLGRKRSK